MNTLVKYQKTQAQEEKLTQMIFSDSFKKVTSKPTLTNDNLLVKTTDIDGRESFYELTPKAKKINTLLWF